MKYPSYGCVYCAKLFSSPDGRDMHVRSKHSNGAALPVGRRPTLIEIDALCIECGKTAQLVGGARIYPHRPDLFTKSYYLCECGAYCGCHPKSVVPLGYPCGPSTRKARSAAHAAFDPIWKSKLLSRSAAYAWLANVTGISPEKCHIGMMTQTQAEQVAASSNGYRSQKP